MSKLMKVKVVLNEFTETFTIPKMEATDEGRYFCRVTNSEGQSDAYVDVSMLGERWGWTNERDELADGRIG